MIGTLEVLEKIKNNPNKPMLFFDLDGTLVDLYNTYKVWDRLKNSDSTLYIDAKPLFNLSGVARMLQRLQRRGYKIGVISWLSMDGTPDFNQRIKRAKTKWILDHFKTFRFDVMYFMEYGQNKSYCSQPGDILFDDSADCRNSWTKGYAFSNTQIKEVLSRL